jgi:hypothetical protein
LLLMLSFKIHARSFHRVVLDLRDCCGLDSLEALALSIDCVAGFLEEKVLPFLRVSPRLGDRKLCTLLLSKNALLCSKDEGLDGLVIFLPGSNHYVDSLLPYVSGDDVNGMVGFRPYLLNARVRDVKDNAFTMFDTLVQT